MIEILKLRFVVIISYGCVGACFCKTGRGLGELFLFLKLLLLIVGTCEHSS